MLADAVDVIVGTGDYEGRMLALRELLMGQSGLIWPAADDPDLRDVLRAMAAGDLTGQSLNPLQTICKVAIPWTDDEFGGAEVLQD